MIVEVVGMPTWWAVSITCIHIHHDQKVMQCADLWFGGPTILLGELECAPSSMKYFPMAVNNLEF